MKRRIRYLWILVVPLTGLVAIILFPDAASTGTAYGIEFCPQTFTHRSFRYFQILGLRVTPLRTREFQCAFDEYVREEGYVSSDGEEPLEWRLVKGFAPGVRGWHGEQKRICWMLGCWDKQDAKLVDWLKTNPDISAILVPELVGAIQRGEYRYALCLKYAFFADSVEECKWRMKNAKLDAADTR